MEEFKYILELTLMLQKKYNTIIKYCRIDGKSVWRICTSYSKSIGFCIVHTQTKCTKVIYSMCLINIICKSELFVIVCLCKLRSSIFLTHRYSLIQLLLHCVFRNKVISLISPNMQGTHCTGKTGEMAKTNPYEGKHREFGNFAKTQGKHREFGLLKL